MECGLRGFTSRVSVLGVGGFGALRFRLRFRASGVEFRFGDEGSGFGLGLRLVGFGVIHTVLRVEGGEFRVLHDVSSVAML